MALPFFMKHIFVLEDSGLIGSKKVGRVRICQIRPRMLAAVELWLTEQRLLWKGRTNRLAEYVEGLERKENSK